MYLLSNSTISSIVCLFLFRRSHTSRTSPSRIIRSFYESSFSVLSRVIFPRLSFATKTSSWQSNCEICRFSRFQPHENFLSIIIASNKWIFMACDLCKMKLRFNRRPDTVRNVVLNPQDEKPAFREESRKSISYLERGDEKKGKSRGGDARRG